MYSNCAVLTRCLHMGTAGTSKQSWPQQRRRVVSDRKDRSTPLSVSQLMITVRCRRYAQRGISSQFRRFVLAQTARLCNCMSWDVGATRCCGF